jgi:hypothetical protein
VVERKERIKLDLLELPLARYAAPCARSGFVGCLRKVPSDMAWIVQVLVRPKAGLRMDDLLESTEQEIPAQRPLVLSVSVLLHRKTSEISLCRHSGDLKA